MGINLAAYKFIPTKFIHPAFLLQRRDRAPYICNHFYTNDDKNRFIHDYTLRTVTRVSSSRMPAALPVRYQFAGKRRRPSPEWRTNSSFRPVPQLLFRLPRRKRRRQKPCAIQSEPTAARFHYVPSGPTTPPKDDRCGHQREGRNRHVSLENATQRQ